MSKSFNISIPGPTAPTNVTLKTGNSMVYVGANGSGKTRLGAYIEAQIPVADVHRIAAQKSLALKDELPIIGNSQARKLLQIGHPNLNAQIKINTRWGGDPAVHPLSDFDALIQTLFAEHNFVASKHLKDHKTNPNQPVPVTELERLQRMWTNLLPHRELEIDEATVRVRTPSDVNVPEYAGSKMSDGERAIFYFLGQCLLAPKECALIIDEPESHIHRAILSPLWDAIEKARPDCCYVYITHDLDFAATSSASERYFIKSYKHTPQQWEIDRIPEETGLSDTAVVELLGSRKPILFIEGNQGSIDLTIYRSMYSDFTIIPIGSCEQVIHSVASYKASSVLHWLNVHGLVDADHRTPSQITGLQQHDIQVLPVAEIENILLLPNVFLALAAALSCSNPSQALQDLASAVVREATENLDLVSARYTTRQLDRAWKQVELRARDLATLQSEYTSQVLVIDPALMFNSFRTELSRELQASNLPKILELYDNKGLLSLGASILGISHKRILMEKVGKMLGGSAGADLKRELESVLPSINV